MKRPLDCESVSEFLTYELERRKRRNDSYSLRAFARDLDLSPSTLSELIKGVVGLSEKMAIQISVKLHLKAVERDFFRDLTLASSARNKTVKALALSRIAELRKIESTKKMKEEQFRVISDWHHAAILELTQIQGFEPDPTWIARRLGITVTQVSSAIERLEEFGLLIHQPDGTWIANQQVLATFSDTPSAAIRKFHRQILSMAMESLIDDPIEDREINSMIVAIPKSRLHEFRQSMNQFLTKFYENVEEDVKHDRPKDELYALSLQLCPIRNRRRG